MAIKKVIQAGHPGLKNKNKTVKDFNSLIIKKLIKDLKDTMYKTGLIGIASSQIAQNFMIFITHPRTTKARKLGKTDKLRIYINPKIIFRSKHENLIYEGCGSVADGAIFGPVSRSREIAIEALDENGQKFRLRCDGILARVILQFNPFSRWMVMCKGYSEDLENFTELVWEDNKYLDFYDRETYPQFQIWSKQSF